MTMVPRKLVLLDLDGSPGDRAELETAGADVVIDAPAQLVEVLGG